MRKSAILKNRDNAPAGVSPHPLLASAAPKPFVPLSGGPSPKVAAPKAAGAGEPAPLKKVKKEEEGERANPEGSVTATPLATLTAPTPGHAPVASGATAAAPAAKKLTAPLQKSERASVAEAAESGVVKRRKLLAITYKKGPSATKSETKSDAASPVIAPGVEAKYFMCMYTKRSTKKHKVYEDGVISVEGNVVKLFDMEAKVIGKTNQYTAANLADLHAGNELFVGAKELEVAAQIDAAKFISGQVFRKHVGVQAMPNPLAAAAPKKAVKDFKSHNDAANLEREKKEIVKTPRHDPEAPNALVLSRDGIVPVVVDPHLAKQLRPHQREGVQFMYDCLLGVRKFDGNGCILADEMGLGKTLQAVTLVWTFLKSGPEGDPLAKKIAIVTPTSLVRNWMREFKRWLGSERVIPITVDDAKNKQMVAEGIGEFFRLPKHKVLILSYETFRAQKEILTTNALDLLILDEGHRIKNVTAQISKALSQVKTRRRVLLTGTPLQNDLKEFYAMVDFCNPSILGTPKFFNEFFDKPIIQSRDISMSDAKREAGEKKFQELSTITNAFMLRRTNQILEDYLPPKSEQVVFCRPSESQVALYRFFLGSKALRQAMAEGAGSSSSLECISLLTKLCNYPGLVHAKAVSYLEAQNEDDVPLGKRVTIDTLFPDWVENEEDKVVRPDLSGKLTVLDSLLSNVRKTTDDRVVVVSNFTKTLDIVQVLCAMRGWKFFRLDGKTEQTKRQTFVDSFNRPSSDVFVFLLSSKAGGTGLNLVGANRLVLFDSDWNPATDRQAMARVWRDGQLKRVFLYRLLMTGSIDEKIFQRQLSKEGLSSSVLDNAFGKVQFSRTDLKDIFSLNVNTVCDTHDLVCDCFRKADDSASGAITKAVARGAGVDISRWLHLNNMEKLDDKALKLVSASEPEAITAVFLLHTDGKKYVYEKKEEEEAEKEIVMAPEDDQVLDLDDE